MAVKGTDDNEPLSTGVTCTTQRVLDGGTALKLLSTCQNVPSPLPNLLLVGPFLPMLPMLATALQRLGDVLQSWTADRQSDTRPCIPLMMSSRIPCPNHLQTIRPTSPVGRIPKSQRPTNTPKRQRGCVFFFGYKRPQGFVLGHKSLFWGYKRFFSEYQQ